MVNYPNSLDDDSTLPYVSDNINEIGAEAINALRDTIFALQKELGTLVKGNKNSLAERLIVSIDEDGLIKSSAVNALNLVSLPITNSQVSPSASIDEVKLNLDFPTTFLNNLILNLENQVKLLQGFVNLTGSKIEPHILGLEYRHKMSDIDVDANAFILNKLGLLRDNTNLLTLFKDLNDEFASHQKADGLNSSTVPPENFAHNASGIHLDTSNFSFVPSTNNNLQSFAEFVDNSSLSLLGSRIQTLYSNGIPRSARGSDLVSDGYGQLIVPSTPVITYLLDGNASAPVDSINNGDDIVLFQPLAADLSNKTFNSKFAKVKSGDIIHINYGTIITSFVIDSVKLITGTSPIYSVRIAGKNLLASSTASATITRPLATDEKHGVLATAIANPESSSYYGSLIVGNPRSASTLSIGFDPSQFDKNHYNLYLALYPSGNPLEKTFNLPAVDITGNKGKTPGKYTLESVVEAANAAFRKNGYNYRFIAFKHGGEFGIMLADPYNNASFSIISGAVNSLGQYDGSSNSSYPYNVIDIYGGIDPLGFGLGKSNVACPAFAASYSTDEKSLVPTKIISPLSRKYYYINGVEKERVSQSTTGYEEYTLQDSYGDGYWLAEITNKVIQSNRVKITYRVNHNLSFSKLKSGKTLVVQPNIGFTDGYYSGVDYGRFMIDDISFNDCNTSSAFTDITVYDAVHGTGISPYVSSGLGTKVRLHFTDDSVEFDTGFVGDTVSLTPYKRYFEIYVNGTSSQSGEVFSHERARFLNTDSDTFNINFYQVSPKLRGYDVGGGAKNITLRINSYDGTTGAYDGYLCYYDGVNYLNQGPVISGKKGEVARFYDETNIDFIEFTFNIEDTISSFSNKNLDINLFPSLILDEEVMLIASCQINDTTKKISYLRDDRQFGNVSEKQLSTSALDFIAAPQRLLAENGVIGGFDLVSSTSLVNTNKVSIAGGKALVNGKILNINHSTVSIPIVKETLYPSFTTDLTTITWFLCVNDKSELEFVASTDYDISLSGTYGSLDHTRMFYVKNPNISSPTAYPIKSSYLERIVSDQKNLLPLYAITATVALSGSDWIVSSASISDIKRYTANGHGGTNTFILSKTGNFRSIASASNYVKQLTGYKSFSATGRNRLGKTIIVRDVFDISGLNFDFSVKTKFIGDGGKFIISSFANIGSNCEFSKLDISISSDIGFNLNGNNVKFEECDFTYSYDATSDVYFTASQLSNLSKACILASTGTSTSFKNISVKGCSFTFTYANHFPAFSGLINDEAHYMENITIENNIINSSFAAEDKRSVFGFASTMIAAPTLTNGPRIVNCSISKNICDKNQLIIISAPLNGSNVVANMLVAINCSISNNICGAICYLTKQDVVSGSYNSSSNIQDKDNMLTISNNASKFIYCGFSSGFLNYSSNRNIFNIISGSNVYSGSATIEQNICSWIQVGVKTPTSYSYEMPYLNISDNKLIAYVSAYLNDYYNGITPSNTAFIVDTTTGT